MRLRITSRRKPRLSVSQVGLCHHVVDGSIEDVPEDEDDEANPESDLSNPEADP